MIRRRTGRGTETREDRLRIALRLSLICLLSLSLGPTSGFSQTARRDAFDPDGSFWVLGELPPEFSDFGGINLNAKKSRWIPPAGVDTNNGKRYRFRTLTVKRDNFTFTTVTVRGISYSFSGKFLKGGVFAADNLDDETPVLEGTLRKFRGGKKIAEADLKFVYFAGT